MDLAIVFVFLVLGVLILAAGLKAQNKTDNPLAVENDMNDILESISKWSRVFGVDPALVKAVIRVESNFNPKAVNPSDPSYGLMQITPMLAQDFGFVKDYKNTTQAEILKIMEIDTNIYIGTRQLSSLLGRHTFNEAVQMYNVGERGYLELGRRASSYLSSVSGYYNEYK